MTDVLLKKLTRLEDKITAFKINLLSYPELQCKKKKKFFETICDLVEEQNLFPSSVEELDKEIKRTYKSNNKKRIIIKSESSDDSDFSDYKPDLDLVVTMIEEYNEIIKKIENTREYNIVYDLTKPEIKEVLTTVKDIPLMSKNLDCQDLIKNFVKETSNLVNLYNIENTSNLREYVWEALVKS